MYFIPAGMDLPMLSTTFAHMFDTNLVPSIEETDGIRSLLGEPEEEIRKIDQEMARLQARRDELQKFVNRHRSLLSLSRRLPGDIWEEIFVRCLPNERFPVQSVAEAPLLLTTICRSWREIALKTPQLWSSIYISLPDPHTEECAEKDFASFMEAWQEGVKLWLARSGALPLKLSLVMYNGPRQWGAPDTPSDTAAQDLHRNFMQFIIQYSRRWTFLSLSYIPQPVMLPFHTLTSADLPLLVDFHGAGLHAGDFVNWNNWVNPPNPTNPPLPFFDAVGSSPSLRHLSVKGRVDIPPQSGAQWALLTELDIEVDSPPFDCVALMQRLARSSPLLCEFAYTSFDHSIRTNETPLDALQFIHLRTLKLTFICEQVPIFGSLFNVFESFTAPALTDLSLVVNPFHSWDSEPFSYPINGNLPFHDFVLRSQCELSSLQLSMPLAEESLKKTLSLLSSLSSFIVDTSLSPGYLHFPVSSANYLDIIVRALSPSNESIRCPALKDLYVTSCRPGEAIVLVNLIEARTVHTTELESLRAKFQTSSRTGVGMLKSALELGKSKGLGVKIKWEYRKQYSEGLDSSYPFATSLSDPEVLVG